MEDINNSNSGINIGISLTVEDTAILAEGICPVCKQLLSCRMDERNKPVWYCAPCRKEYYLTYVALDY